MSIATRERNNTDDGPIKKPDIFGTYINLDIKYTWEILYGEISNGPFANTTQSKVHKKEDRVKLGKLAKDSVDNACKFYASNYRKLPLDFQKLKICLLQGSATVLELFILDKKYLPLYRLRRLAIVELPLQKNSSSLDSIINLVSVLLTFHELLRDNLMIIQSVDKKLVVDGCDEIIDMGDYKDPIPTSNTPRQSTNVKKKINAKGSS
ncbi:7852_t:CDS:2 [Gigaspora rosea]|nr:7852_t:CDS:2 [Gigaspora rosea]